jgi:hypothetical protein
MNEADLTLGALQNQVDYLAEIANMDPEQFQGREAALYRVLNRMQLITSRFVPGRAANDSSFDGQLALVEVAFNVGEMG